MNIETLLEAIQTQAIRGPTNVDVRTLAYDSRRVQPGALFVALPGLRDDGVRYIEDAVARGAVGIVSEGKPWVPRTVTHIGVEDARRALAEIACAFYDRPSSRMAVAGVTGTNGKTTISFMVRDMLRAAGQEPGMIGTVVYEMGRRVIPASRTTPEAPDLQDMMSQMVRAGCRSAVLEVSSHALAQKRVWGVDFDVAIFTNLTHDHLDYHRSMEAYFESKALLFQGLGRMGKPGTAVLNLDNDWGRRLAGTPGAWKQTLTFGEHASADVRAAEVSFSAEGARFLLCTPAGSVPVQLPMLGAFNVSNALASVAAALALNVPLDVCVSVLEGFTSAPGRLEPVPFRRGVRVFVDYAHTDDALFHVLAAIRPNTTGRLILVFGCGGNRDRAKRPRMGAVAARGADRTVLTSDNPRDEDPEQILKDIASGFSPSDPYEIIVDREKAIRAALDSARTGDVVIIAGKGHENYQEFHRTVVPFDDREVVRRHAGKSG